MAIRKLNTRDNLLIYVEFNLEVTSLKNIYSYDAHLMTKNMLKLFFGKAL